MKRCDEKDVALYKDFMHYGKILKCEDFIFESDNIFITMKVAELDRVRMMFVIRNGQLVALEKLRGFI